MKKSILFSYLAIIALPGLFLQYRSMPQKHSQAKSKPNFIVIFADDLGYGDLSCFGSEGIHTPYLDKMAANGAKMTSFYANSPVCTPSRAGLMTGRYQVRSGLTQVLFPNSLDGLDSTEITIAELLKKQGYVTGIVGKWHLGHLPAFMPNRHGFDYYFGLPYSNDMEWAPRKDPPTPLYRNEKIIAQPVNQGELTQRYTIEAVHFIAENRDKPFFLYMPHTFPHNPLHVSAEYKGTSKAGLYGDVVQELDKSVGEVLNALERYGIANNTIVVFSSDNGPVERKGLNSTGGLRGFKTTNFEGGIRVPTLVQWKGKIPAGKVIEQPAIMLDWFTTFAKLSGAKLPTDRAIDGEDISQILTGEGKRLGEDFYFYWNDKIEAVRSGKWKYMKANPTTGKRKTEPYGEQLFDLDADRNETNNLIEKYPHIAQALKKKIEDFERSLGHVPSQKIRSVPFEVPQEK